MGRHPAADTISRRRRSRKPAIAKRKVAKKARPRRRSSVTILREQLARRTQELLEAREQQNATAEVLQVINSSQGDLTPVVNSILEKAHELCSAPCGSLQLYENDRIVPIAVRGMTPAFEAFLRAGYPITESIRAGVVSTLPIQYPDIAQQAPDMPAFRVAFELGEIRTLAAVPLVKNGVAFGRIVAGRKKVHPFTDSQINLLKEFAAQAVNAIETVRLFNETREALERQKATAEVLGVISNSVADTQPVFDSICASLQRLMPGADLVISALGDDGMLHWRAGFGELIEQIRASFPRPAPTQQGLVTGVPSNWPDIMRSPGVPESLRASFAAIGRNASMLSSVMSSNGRVLGTLAALRLDMRPFTNEGARLLKAFADQAVIAIQNARMFRELSESLDELRTAQDRLIQTEKLASLGQLTAGIAHEIKNPLNFINNFSALSVELTDELRDVLKQERITEKGREEADELTGLLKDNLSKVVQHGKRADSIVKNMLLHSREGSGERRSVEINSLVEESLNLAYHGARAEKADFNIALEREFDPSGGLADAYPQEITRVLLNVISNGFYAATRRASEVGNGFEPKLRATTRDLGDKVEIRVRDNGMGIPDEVKDKVFNPFFTTKPTGEGTGLGLSMSYDIVVKQHGGTIEIETEVGAFTEFRIVLPRTGKSRTKSEEQE